MSAAKPAKIIVCKLGDNGRALNQTLENAGFQSHWLPLQQIEYLSIENEPYTEQLQQARGLIFTSKYAVLALADSPLCDTIATKKIYAIGPATAQAIVAHLTSKQAQSRPSNDCSEYKVVTVEPANSEALIGLMQQHHELDQHWILCKGEQGRDLIETEFSKHNGTLNSWQLYRRKMNSNNIQALQLTLERHFNALKSFDELTIVCTNGESLTILNNVISRTNRQSLHLIVPSERIAQLAQQSGYQNVHNSSGPMNDAIIQCIHHLLDLTK